VRASSRPAAVRRPGTLRSSAALVACLVLLCKAGSVVAQEDAEATDSTAGLELEAGRARIIPAERLEGSIEVDGRIDEPAWAGARVIDDFVQGEPVEGANPFQPTEVRILFDDDAIYVAARMTEPDPDSIAAQLVRRDEMGTFDYFTLSLDPNRDGLTGYEFRVSAANVQADAYLYDDTRDDRNWNAVWSSGVTRDESGWSMEMRIPLSQIRYDSSDEPQEWGINFTRRRIASNSVSYYTLESRNVRGKVSQFGRLDGVVVQKPPRRLEFLPYVASEMRTAPAVPGNPLFDGSEFTPRVGLDFSAGLGSAFSLDGTINPDFGQVEVDPEVINLTAFETFFEEKRPFFVRDAQIFNFSLSGHRNQLFFSRRIGREPRGGDLGDATFTDVPGQTNILGAAKLTGRTTGGLSVGVLGAATKGQTGRAYFDEDGRIEDFLVEPGAQHGVVRLQQDFGGGTSRIGGILTAQRRSLPEDGSFDFLTSNAYSAGLDFQHQWGGTSRRDWRVHGFFTGGYAKGPEEALLRIQQSSNHYFQRPDADYLEVDSTATSISGVNWRVQFERQNAEHWTWSVWTGQVTPGFEINDLGFSTSGERLDAGARIGYRDITPSSWYRQLNMRLFTFHNWRHSLLNDFFSAENWSHSHRAGMISLSGDLEFLNNWELELRSSYDFTLLSDTKTRGGPLMTQPGSIDVDLEVTTDRRKALSLGPSLMYRHRFLGNGEAWSAGLEVTWRPAPSWEFELQPTFGRDQNGSQYVTSTDTEPFEPTYGRRYLFGDLNRYTASMETRLNVAFTPNVSLQLFLQPLISSGDYRSYRQLERSESFDLHQFTPGTASQTNEGVRCEGGDICLLDGDQHVDFTGDGLADYSFSDRDFNIRSLRGSAVLRWEYRPGSVLFLVWQHARRESFDTGEFDFGGSVGGLFSGPSENAIMVKASYYLPF
jgi:hypothetical protein